MSKSESYLEQDTSILSDYFSDDEEFQKAYSWNRRVS